MSYQMYWSSFSPSWYEMTLNEIGLDFVSKYKDVRDFLGEKETTWFMLYQKPITALNMLTQLIAAKFRNLLFDN